VSSRAELLVDLRQTRKAPAVWASSSCVGEQISETGEQRVEIGVYTVKRKLGAGGTLCTSSFRHLEQDQFLVGSSGASFSFKFRRVPWALQLLSRNISAREVSNTMWWGAGD